MTSPASSASPTGGPPEGAASAATDDLLDLLRLHLATSYRFDVAARVLRLAGTARQALHWSQPELVDRLGITPALARKLTSTATGRQAEEELALARREGLTVLVGTTCGDGLTTLHPSTLRQGPDGPLILFARGGLCVEGSLAIGVVGSRRPSVYGRRQTRRFAAGLARAGVVVVSGLARGVDGESHRAALDAGGCTVAVLGSGLGRIYPPEHGALAERIWSQGRGLVVTPFPFRASPRSHHFPLRNGVLSGLSRVLLVVEAGEKSGSLITVDHALRQGKPVFAVPGRVDELESRGCLRLIDDGAGLAIDPGDLIVALLSGEGLPEELRAELASRFAVIGSGHDPRPTGLPGPQGEALTRLFEECDTWHPDALASRLQTDVAELLAELARLEMTGLLARLPGGAYARAGS